MHGIVFSELRKYAEEKHGPGTWNALIKRAGLEGKMYLPLNAYPDEDALALVEAASAVTGLPSSTVLEDFGMFIAPGLLKMYGHLIARDWKSLDIIQNTEVTIHTVVRINNPGARPPELQTVRLAKDQVRLIYTSPRKLCHLAIGIGKGMALQFHENLSATQKRCMHRGAKYCEIVFKVEE
jgi:Haem-NO-binding